MEEQSNTKIAHANWKASARQIVRDTKERETLKNLDVNCNLW